MAIEIPLGPPERSGLVEEIRERQKTYHGTCHECGAKGEILSFHKSKLKAVDFVKKSHSPSHEGVPREKKKIT